MSRPDRVTDLLAERGRERRALVAPLVAGYHHACDDGCEATDHHSGVWKDATLTTTTNTEYPVYVSTASRAEPGDALQTNPPAVDSVCGRCDGSGVIQQGFHYMGPGFRTALQGDPCPEHGEYTGDHCAVFVTDEVNYEDIGPCGYESRIGERDLAERRELGRIHRCWYHGKGFRAQKDCLICHPPHTASRAEPDDALLHDFPITERDLAYALEEALLHDGDRRRAMAVLILWKEQERG